MKTCETCICWRKIGHSPALRHHFYDTGPLVIPAGDEGQCRLGPPVDDFRWPLTKAGDWCGQHREAPAGDNFGAGTNGEAPPAEGAAAQEVSAATAGGPDNRQAARKRR